LKNSLLNGPWTARQIAMVLPTEQFAGFAKTALYAKPVEKAMDGLFQQPARKSFASTL